MPSESYGWRQRIAPWVLPLALVVMIAELAILGRFLWSANAPRGEVAGVTQVAPAAPPVAKPTEAVAPAVAKPAEAVVPTAAPPKAAQEAPAAAPATPTSAPPTATAVARPVLAPPTQAPPAPEATVAAPAAAPAAPPPAPSRAEGPAAAVARFYELVEQGQFDAAAGLWSPRMQAAYPPGQNIHGRFAQTDSLSVQSAAPQWVDEANGRAAVAIDLVEILDSGAARRWVGTWYLVRSGSGWLLDQPSLNQG